MKSGPYGLYILGDPCATNLIGKKHKVGAKKAGGLNGS